MRERLQGAVRELDGERIAAEGGKQRHAPLLHQGPQQPLRSRLGAAARPHTHPGAAQPHHGTLHRVLGYLPLGGGLVRVRGRVRGRGRRRRRQAVLGLGLRLGGM